ncbi:hypothetical protein SZ64_05545 [Erythrobacter sp. SG61-1L]|uniref:hypothetical protein n=1 Tax=Erythrobacter sp. SG61-1L TaxID=1603897 RepID=UPI0006C8E897|nr:hypothetical protein [Erythrobacter sp. SG61-1L]KPL67622.1 hypothetical protein SZ64_05545 [Erythrobacter sp. SG61-1L]
MTRRTLLIPAAMASALALGACASNYAGEGALAGAAVGAGVGVLSGGNVGESAAIGAGVGAVGGALIEKDGKCYRRDDRGREYEVRCRHRRR